MHYIDNKNEIFCSTNKFLSAASGRLIIGNDFLELEKTDRAASSEDRTNQ